MYSMDEQALRLAKDLLVCPAALVDVATPISRTLVRPVALVHNLMRMGGMPLPLLSADAQRSSCKTE